jgi:hypothetical protein
MRWVEGVSTNVWVRVVFVVLMLASISMVTALRPADDREVLLRGLPPPTAALPLRLAELRRNVGRQARHQLVVAFCLGVIVILVIGSLVALSVREFSASGVAGVFFIAAYVVVTWYVFANIYLLARYLGARRRLQMEAQVAPTTSEN